LRLKPVVKMMPLRLGLELLKLRVPKIERLVIAGLVMRGTERI